MLCDLEEVWTLPGVTRQEAFCPTPMTLWTGTWMTMANSLETTRSVSLWPWPLKKWIIWGKKAYALQKGMETREYNACTSWDVTTKGCERQGLLFIAWRGITNSVIHGSLRLSLSLRHWFLQPWHPRMQKQYPEGQNLPYFTLQMLHFHLSQGKKLRASQSVCDDNLYQTPTVTGQKKLCFFQVLLQTKKPSSEKKEEHPWKIAVNQFC